METEAYFKETLQAGEALFDMVRLLQQASLDVFLAAVLVKKNKVDQEVSPYWDFSEYIFPWLFNFEVTHCRVSHINRFLSDLVVRFSVLIGDCLFELV